MSVLIFNINYNDQLPSIIKSYAERKIWMILRFSEMNNPFARIEQINVFHLVRCQREIENVNILADAIRVHRFRYRHGAAVHLKRNRNLPKTTAAKKITSESNRRRLTKYLKTTWATVLPYFVAICRIRASYKKPGFCCAGIGRPSGQYAVTTIFLCRQNSVNLF